MQVVAYAAAKVFVIDPGAHTAQAAEDMPLNWPATHAVHVVAPLLTTPVPTPISAIDPAAQTAQATVDDAEYVPELHAKQLTAPAPANVLVTEPAGHATHATVDTLLY